MRDWLPPAWSVATLCGAGQGFALHWLYSLLGPEASVGLGMRVVPAMTLILVLPLGFALFGLRWLQPRALTSLIVGGSLMALVTLLGVHQMSWQFALDVGMAQWPWYALVLGLLWLATLATVRFALLDVADSFAARNRIVVHSLLRSQLALLLGAGACASLWLVLMLAAWAFALIGFEALMQWLLQPQIITILAMAAMLGVTQYLSTALRYLDTVLVLAGTVAQFILVLVLPFCIGFLVALPLTGLASVWQSGSGTVMFALCSAGLLALYWLAWQDAERKNPAWFDVLLRYGTVTIIAFALLAGWGLGLRVLTQGWSFYRLAAAIAIVALTFAGAGALASQLLARRQRWALWRFSQLGSLALAVFLALVSVLPPLHLGALASYELGQKLHSAQVDWTDTDYAIHTLGRAGVQELQRLAAHGDGLGQQIARRLRLESTPEPVVLDSVSLTVHGRPQGLSVLDRRTLQFILEADRYDTCRDDSRRACHLLWHDLDGDQVSEALYFKTWDRWGWVYQFAGGLWHGEERVLLPANLREECLTPNQPVAESSQQATAVSIGSLTLWALPEQAFGEC